MARIRSIKPELPQSETMGRVSREARLCFVLLWTLADDEGRLRGNSRMLASLLYPYDDDAKELIDGWLTELDHEGCIVRYTFEGDTFIQVAKWLSHQKIDKPSASKIPAFDEGSRGFARIREDSAADQGRDQGREGIKEGSCKPSACVDRFALDAPRGHGEPLAGPDAELIEPDPNQLELLAIDPGDPPLRLPRPGYVVPPCPHEAIVEGYAETLPGLPGVAVLNESRKRTLNARWREVCAEEKLDQAGGLDFFARYWRIVKDSKFLLGYGSVSRDTGRAWRADFDWLIAPTNFVRVVEGRYADETQDRRERTAR